MGNKFVGLIICALLLAQFPSVVHAQNNTSQLKWDFGQAVDDTTKTVNKVEIIPSPATTPAANNTAVVVPTQTINQATVTAPTKLTALINSTLKKDDNIRKVEVKDNQIKVDYQQTTKLLGLIPAKFNLRISADPSQKKLNISRPWWTILGNTNVRRIFDKLRSGMNGLSSSDTSTTLNQQSQIIQTISSVMKKVTPATNTKSNTK